MKCDEIEVKSGKELAGALPSGALVVALEVEGDAVTSTELSKRVERWGSTGGGVVAFVIGGADGIPKELRSAAARLSLSKLTLPHRLARVLQPNSSTARSVFCVVSLTPASDEPDPRRSKCRTGRSAGQRGGSG